MPNILINANGDAPDTHVAGGNSVTWTLASNATQSYSIDPPANIFVGNPACFTLSSGQTSSSFTVKNNAGVGHHGYTINAGNCPGESKGGRAGSGVGTGAAMIIVDPGTAGETGPSYPKA
jgi:hypothetical protein